MGITTASLWTWDTSTASPTVSAFFSGSPTKTGLTPQDLRDFVGVPIQLYNTVPPTAVPDLTLQKWIRWAEDSIEQSTGILLCQSFVASPPARTPEQARAIGITPTFSGGYQKLGVDYDIEDSGYDFLYPRARDEGWMVYSLRYRPVKSVDYGPLDPNAIKQISYVYPLLNEYFRVPPAWQVEDHDFGMIRLVPSTNVQMLPLFAMQLAFMGFAESVPGAIWMQYTAGLTASDYSARFSFMRQLVLAHASAQALATIQGTISMGAEEYSMTVDGMQYVTRYGKNGPFDYMIKRFESMRDELLDKARTMVAGPVMTTL